MSCSSLQVQELEKASFRQSIYYECNQDYLIKDTCLTSSEIKKHQNGEVGLYGVDIPIQAENLKRQKFAAENTSKIK
uniref:Uncharacterized protein n=1 Tax=Magallana gigas TaxID=29159 RepID=K1QCG7_MAGGI